MLMIYFVKLIMIEEFMKSYSRTLPFAIHEVLMSVLKEFILLSLMISGLSLLMKNKNTSFTLVANIIIPASDKLKFPYS